MADIKRNTTRVMSNNPHAMKRTFSNRMLTGEFAEPVPVRVDMINATPDVVMNHNLQTVSDFTSSDFFLPLTLFAVVYALQFMTSYLIGTLMGIIGVTIVAFLEVVLVRDLLARINRRPSGKVAAGMVQPYTPGSWGWSFLIYLASVPFLFGAAWLNIRLIMAFASPAVPAGQMSAGYLGSATVRAFQTVLLFYFFIETVGAVVFAPLCEEMWFRGVGLAAYMKTGSRFRAVVWTSVIFGALHGPSRFLFATLLGFVTSFIRIRTGSLYCSMAVHALHNSMVMAVTFYMMTTRGVFG